MLMAQLPPHNDSELRRATSLPGPVQLPSFKHFLSGAGHSDLPGAPANRSPTTRSEPPDEIRTAPPSLRDDSFHRQAQNPHYVHVRPKAQFQRPSLPEPLRELNQTFPINTLYPMPQHVTSDRSHLPAAVLGPPAPNNKMVVKEASIEGKGVCYVYEDGSVCQKVIDGDMVNPKWGTTKAGKPRKRLGQACNTCREKKIRCDPQLPKCAQCQKFGRECKFESGSRSSKHPSQSDSTSSHDTQILAHHERTGSSTSAEALTDRTYSRANSRGSMNVENLLSPSSTVEVSPSTEQPPSKRSRFSSPPNRPINSPSRVIGEYSPERLGEVSRNQPETGFAYNVDPMLVDPRLTMYYAREYFKRVNTSVYMLLHPNGILRWIEQNRSKSMSDIMLVYAILAAGSAFSPDKTSETDPCQFKQIVEIALDRSPCTELQAVQTRLLLSVTEHSIGQSERGKEISKSALHLAYAIGLNEEIETVYPDYDMDVPTYLECRRRAFWLAYVSSCFREMRLGAQGSVEPLLCKLRLPCENDQFQVSQIPDLPILHIHATSEWDFSCPEKLGNSAVLFFVEMSLIVKGAVAWLNTNRSDMNASEYRASYEKIRSITMRRLAKWDRRTKEYYKVPLTGLHILYYYVGIILHRHVKHDFLHWEQIQRNSQETRSHAIQLLEMTHAVHEEGGKNIPVLMVANHCPMAGDTILQAIDVISAAGTISSLLEHQSREFSFIELVSGGLQALDTLAGRWKSAEQQLAEVKPRISTVVSFTTSGTSIKKAAFFIRKPLVSVFGLERDIVYGIPRLEYLRALGHGDRVRSEDDIWEMGSQSPN